MGLFDKFLKKEKKEFKEKIIICESVNEELSKISKEYDIPVSLLDFEILSYKTLIKDKHEFLEADEEILEELRNENKLLDENLQIKQQYEIKVHKYIPIDGFEIIGQVRVNKYLTKASFLLSPQSDLSNFNEIKFYEEMNKKKLKTNLFIGIFDEKIQEDIQKLGKKIRANKFNEVEEIFLCQGIDPIETVDAKIVYHYKKSHQSVKKQKIYPIQEGGILIEIVRPKEGRNGRNCKGEIIKVKKSKELILPDIEFNPNAIKKEENEDKIVYIAKRSGYVSIVDGVFDINNKLKIKEINLKVGDIKDAHNSNVAIEVLEEHALKEAIADNMIVEADDLIIRGNIGAKAQVKANKLKVDGQTHKKSTVFSKKAKIHKHKGYIEADEVEIDILEGGRVKAKKVKINQAVGGEVIANFIEINELLSHIKAYALYKIEIEKIKGEENILCISPKKLLENKTPEKIVKDIEEINLEIEELEKEILKRQKILKKNKPAYEELKKKYLEAKKNKKKPSSILIREIKKYQNFQKKYLELKEKLKNLKEEKDLLIELAEDMQSAIYDAKVISYSSWTAYNRIEFELVEPPVTLRYDTKGYEGVCGFAIKFVGFIPKITKIKVENDKRTKRKNI